MEFKILDVAAGEGINDVVVTVAHWYKDFDRGLGREPDYIEDHLIKDFPVDLPGLPILNENGHFILEDGTIFVPYEEVDGEWVERPLPDNVKREPVLPIEERLLQPITERVQAIADMKVNLPIAEDIFHPGDLKKLSEKKTKKQKLADNPKVKGLKGHTKRVNRRA